MSLRLMSRKIIKLQTGLVVVLAFLAALFVFSNNTHATDSITVTVSGNPTVTVSPTSEGTFADSGNITIGVTSTAASGYTLAITGSGNTSLVGTSDNTKSITSISSAIDQNTFNTNTSYNNKWGYKPSMHYNTSTEQRASNSNYLPSPTNNADIIDVTSDSSSNNYTLSIGARVTSTLGFQTYENNAFVITAVGNSHVPDCDSTKLCVEYEGNGLTYDGETLNRVNYNSTITQQQITKYSHSPNVDDEGYAPSPYANSLDLIDTVTIDGASTLNVAVYYDTESTSYDWVSVYQSPFTISNANDATVSTTTGNLSGKLAGRNSGRTQTYTSWYTQTYTVTGDTVKFHFRTDGVGQYYGYYAIITGTGTTIERTVASGEYATPTGTNAIFHGWSTTQTTPGGGLPSDVEYANESEILAKMPGDEGETKTLYAVWQQSQAITFTMDSNVTKIDVLDSSGTTVGTITSSGQSLTLAQGDTYTIKPTHTSGYGTNTITKTSGAGTLNGKEFTVGAGAATISVTSRTLTTFDQAYAAAGKTKYNNYYKIQDMNSTICSNVDSADLGVIGQVIDTRDNEVYYIGKLADNKCWMLDNLRLNPATATLNTSNTNMNASVTPTYTNTTSSFNSYTAAQFNANYKDNTTTSYGPGSGKIGVYYNFCAASAGTICTNSNSSDASYDICPAGWRMPTGGSSGEYQALYAAYSSNVSDFQTALSTPLSGYFYNGSAGNQGTYGRFWSSTYHNGNNMYYLNVNSSNVYPSYNLNRFYGFSLRCILSS